MNPGRRDGDQLLDTVFKGLKIAESVYGLKTNMEEKEKKDLERTELKMEKERLKHNRLNKGEQRQLHEKGFVPVKEGTAGAFQFEDADTGVVSWVAKQNKPAIMTPYQQKQLELEQQKLDLLKQKAAGKGGGGGKPWEYTDDEGNVRVGSIVNGRPTKSPDDVVKTPSKPPKDITVQERNTLQSAFDKDPEVRKAKTVMQSWSDASAIIAEPSPAADLSLVYAYMKALDPGSVVRESEAETAQALGGVLERAKGKLQDMVGDGRLTPDQRAGLAREIEKLAENAASGLDQIEAQFKEHATRRNVDVQDLRFSTRPKFKPKEQAPGAPAASAGPASGPAPSAGAGKLPPGTVVTKGGKRYQVGADGESVEEIR